MVLPSASVASGIATTGLPPLASCSFTTPSPLLSPGTVVSTLNIASSLGWLVLPSHPSRLRSLYLLALGDFAFLISWNCLLGTVTVTLPSPVPVKSPSSTLTVIGGRVSPIRGFNRYFYRIANFCAFW